MKTLLTLSEIITSGNMDVRRGILVATGVKNRNQEVDFPVGFYPIYSSPPWSV